MNSRSTPNLGNGGIKIGAFRFAPSWIPSFATGLISVLLFNLGLWQLDRAHYKETVLDRIAAHSKDDPYDLHSLLRMREDINDYPVRLRGHYLNEFNLLLDNRPHNQIPGYEVLTPFVCDDNIILVNRGWIAQGVSREHFPSIPAIDGETTIYGIVNIPNPRFFVLKEDDYTQISWPFLIQKIDLEKTEHLLDHQLAPLVVRLNPEPDSGFIREWNSHFMGPEKHYGYAVQWFGLFAALLVIFAVVNTERIHPATQKEEQ